jgi:hypothetical protein
MYSKWLQYGPVIGWDRNEEGVARRKGGNPSSRKEDRLAC